jgi:hypothetical protein
MDFTKAMIDELKNNRWQEAYERDRQVELELYEKKKKGASRKISRAIGTSGKTAVSCNSFTQRKICIKFEECLSALV